MMDMKQHEAGEDMKKEALEELLTLITDELGGDTVGKIKNYLTESGAAPAAADIKVVKVEGKPEEESVSSSDVMDELQKLIDKKKMGIED